MVAESGCPHGSHAKAPVDFLCLLGAASKRTYYLKVQPPGLPAGGRCPSYRTVYAGLSRFSPLRTRLRFQSLIEFFALIEIQLDELKVCYLLMSAFLSGLEGS